MTPYTLYSMILVRLMNKLEKTDLSRDECERHYVCHIAIDKLADRLADITFELIDKENT